MNFLTRLIQVIAVFLWNVIYTDTNCTNKKIIHSNPTNANNDSASKRTILFACRKIWFLFICSLEKFFHFGCSLVGEKIVHSSGQIDRMTDWFYLNFQVTIMKCVVSRIWIFFKDSTKFIDLDGVDLSYEFFSPTKFILHYIILIISREFFLFFTHSNMHARLAGPICHSIFKSGKYHVQKWFVLHLLFFKCEYKKKKME